MKIEVSIHDHEGNPRPWRAITLDLMEKVMVAGVALYGTKQEACRRFAIGRSTAWRRSAVSAAKAPEPAPIQRHVPVQRSVPVQRLAPVKIVSDLNYLEAKELKRVAASCWTPEKDRQLGALYAQRFSCGAIAVELGLPVRTIERRLAQLGFRPSAHKLERENAL